MPALSERKIDIVRTLVESAPDKVVGGLRAALAGAETDPVLGRVLVLVESEARDRMLRNFVLKPVAALCLGEGSAGPRLTFPAVALGHAWRGLKAVSPRAVAEVDDAMEDMLGGQRPPDMLDALTVKVAAGLRAGGNRNFELANEACERVRPGGAAAFASCFDLAPLVRRSLPRLPAWISHMDADGAASARLTYRDAVALTEDGGLRVFEMLAAQLQQPWMILRLISTVVDDPTERLVADSELATFGERILAEIDEGLAILAAFGADSGSEAAHAVGRAVDLATRQINELEQQVALSRRKGWAARLQDQRKRLAGTVEKRLNGMEAAMLAALPTQAAKGVVRRRVPLLTAPPDPAAIERAVTLLNFCRELRTSASYGGFASARGKVIEALAGMLDQYLEDLLEQLRTDEAADAQVARVLLGVIGDFTLLLRDAKAADIVRRRAAAAFHANELGLRAR